MCMGGWVSGGWGWESSKQSVCEEVKAGQAGQHGRAGLIRGVVSGATVLCRWHLKLTANAVAEAAKGAHAPPGLSCTMGMSRLRASSSVPILAFLSTPAEETRTTCGRGWAGGGGAAVYTTKTVGEFQGRGCGYGCACTCDNGMADGGEGRQALPLLKATVATNQQHAVPDVPMAAAAGWQNKASLGAWKRPQACLFWLTGVQVVSVELSAQRAQSAQRTWGLGSA